MTRWEYLIDNLVQTNAPAGVFGRTEYKENLVIRCTHIPCNQCPYYEFESSSSCEIKRAEDYPVIIANIYETHPELLL